MSLLDDEEDISYDLLEELGYTKEFTNGFFRYIKTIKIDFVANKLALHRPTIIIQKNYQEGDACFGKWYMWSTRTPHVDWFRALHHYGYMKGWKSEIIAYEQYIKNIISNVTT